MLRLIFRAIPMFISSIAAPSLACQSYVGPMNLDYGTRAELIVSAALQTTRTSEIRWGSVPAQPFP